MRKPTIPLGPRCPVFLCGNPVSIAQQEVMCDRHWRLVPASTRLILLDLQQTNRALFLRALRLALDAIESTEATNPASL